MPEMLFRFVWMMEVDDRQREQKGKEHDMWNSKRQEADSVLTVSIKVRLLTFAQITNKPNKHDSVDSICTITVKTE